MRHIPLFRRHSPDLRIASTSAARRQVINKRNNSTNNNGAEPAARGQVHNEYNRTDYNSSRPVADKLATMRTAQYQQQRRPHTGWHSRNGRFPNEARRSHNGTRRWCCCATPSCQSLSVLKTKVMRRLPAEVAWLAPHLVQNTAPPV